MVNKEDINNQLASLPKNTIEIVLRKDDIDSLLKKMGEKINELEKENKALKKTNSELKKEIKGLKDKIKGLNNEIEELQKL